MALISTQVVTIVGLTPSYGAAAAGDTADCGDDYWIVVKNGGGSPITVTLVVPGNLVTGDAYPDKAYTVANGAEMWMPLLSVYADPTDLKCHITYSSTTSVTRAVVRI